MNSLENVHSVKPNVFDARQSWPGLNNVHGSRTSNAGKRKNVCCELRHPNCLKGNLKDEICCGGNRYVYPWCTFRALTVDYSRKKRNKREVWNKSDVKTNVNVN